MDELHAQFEGERVDSVFVYTREAHPGELRGHHESLEQKVRYAREMVEHFGIRRRMLVDTLDGVTHRAYGGLPNMTYVVARGGRVEYRASWTDDRTLRFALETLALARSGRKAGQRVLPYFMEWQPKRVNDPRAFFDGLVNIGGERAAVEYIEAAAEAFGEAHVKVHRRYLEQWREGRHPRG